MSKIYYCRPDGLSSVGTGYTAAQAFSGITSALNVAISGDTIRIAPGTYYGAITLTNSGTAAYPIIIYGDKEAQYFLDLHPGAVRITGCNAKTGIGACTTQVINGNAKIYNNFYNLVIDGTTGTAGCGVRYCGDNCNFYDCIFSASWVSIYGNDSNCNVKCYRCIAIGEYGYVYTTNYNCAAIAGYYCYYLCKCYNSVSIGGEYGFGGATNVYYNCTAFGSYLGGFSTCGLVTNCVSDGCMFGFYGDSTTLTLKKCKAINCYTGFYGTSATNKINVNDCKYAQCNLATRGSNTYDTGTATEAKYEGWADISKLLKLATAIKPDIFETGWSSDLHSYTVAGATTPTTANNDYVSVGTYNSQNLYQSIFKDTLIFFSKALIGLNPNNWIIQTNATITPDDTAISSPNYAYCATLTGTYTNSGNFTGTIVNAAFTPITFSENYDVLHQNRRMGDGILDCGAYEYSTVAMEWTTYHTYAPAIKISQAGQKRLVIPVKNNVNKTISCWSYFSGATVPQMIVFSTENILSITGQTISVSDPTNLTWNQLSTNVTPVADGMLFIDLYATDTGTNSYTIFSDFKL